MLSLVSTAGGLIFGGDTNGRFRAFDQETGKVLWEVNLGSPISGYPVSFAVDGKQYVAVSTGSSLTAMGVEPPDARAQAEPRQQPVRLRASLT